MLQIVSMTATESDRIVFGPADVDLSRSPLRGSICDETYVLGAFNPGLTRLPNGNLLMMVRVAEALCEPMRDDHVAVIRWRKDRYLIDRAPPRRRQRPVTRANSA